MAISKKILKQVNSVMKTVLRNRGVLYALCIIALFNIVMYANVKDFNSVITLVLTGFVTSFFSKNMIVILAMAIAVPYLLNYSAGLKEGMEDKKEGMEDEDEKEGMEDEEKEDGEEDTSDKPMTEEKDGEEKEASNTSVNDIADGESADAKKSTAPSKQERKKMLYDNLQNDFKSFQTTQDAILKGMQEIDPLLAKAESFIEKFEHYSQNLNK